MSHVRTEKICFRRSDVREASENVSNVSRQFLIWLIELRPHVLRGSGLGLLLQDSRLLLYFLFLFQEGKVYENAGKQTNRYVSNQVIRRIRKPYRKKKDLADEGPFSFQRSQIDDCASSCKFHLLLQLIVCFFFYVCLAFMGVCRKW